MVNKTRRIITISWNVLGEVDSFKYLWSYLQMNGGFDENIKYKIWFGGSCGEKYLCSILYDRRIPIKLKGKFNKSVVRQTMLLLNHITYKLYDSEC